MKNTDKLFQQAHVDAVLVVSDKNRMYFTGFQSTFGYLVLLAGNKNVFITDPRYFEMAQELQSDLLEVRQIPNGTSAMGMVKDLLTANHCKTVGFEDTELTVAQFGGISKQLTSFQLVPVGTHIAYVRSFKDATEISYIRKAQSITDAAFKQVLPLIKVGMTERQLAVELEYLLAKNGSEGLAFDTIIASGPNSSKPHNHPSDRAIKAGDPVTMDFGARYHGYCSDMTRTVFVGEPSDDMRRIYNIVLKAQNYGIVNAYCGMAGRELDSYCREVIKANGFENFFTHGTGHSLGIDIHEEPRASLTCEAPLLANQFVTCEPGIYVPGIGGVRIEDLLLIQEDEVIDLTTSEKEITIL